MTSAPRPDEKTCHRCGRTGTRGFWTQIRMHPEANRTLCTNGSACERRRLALPVAVSQKHDFPSAVAKLPVESARTACQARFTLSGMTLACTRTDEHNHHLAPVVINGTSCDVGWRDGDKGAWL